MATGDTSQAYRIEVRFDLVGTEAEARAAAAQACAALAGVGDGVEVTAIFDENWNEL